MYEKWLVVGFRPLNFKDKQTGQEVSGYNLYLLRSPNPDQASEDKTVGKIVEKLFISSSYVKYDPALDDEIILMYNKYGKVGAIQVV